MKKLRIGIIGATSMVGKEIIKVLYKREFPVDDIELFDSAKLAGKRTNTMYGDRVIKWINEVDYSNLDIVFFTLDRELAAENAKKATKEGCVVIDNSRAFESDDKIPLIVPEVNLKSIGKKTKIIANPASLAIISAVPLNALHAEYGLDKVIISSYKSVSDADTYGISELKEEARKVLNAGKYDNKAFEHRSAFNVIPQIGKFNEDNLSEEEARVESELHRIFDDKFAISCSAVRVPVFRADSASLVVKLKKKVDIAKVQKLFDMADGLELIDQPAENQYPMPITASTKHNIEVGRVRASKVFGDKGVEFFLCADHVLKGAALNAVQIAEIVLKKQF